jgi:hypothetical protein
VEGMTTSQSTNVIIVINGVNADSASISRVRQLFRWDGSLYPLFIFIVVILGCHFMYGSFRCHRGLGRLGTGRCSRTIVESALLSANHFWHSMFGSTLLNGCIRLRWGQFSSFNVLGIFRISLDIVQACRSGGGSIDSSCGRKALFSTVGTPCFVFYQREFFIDLFDGHQLLFASASVLSRHRGEIYAIRVLAVHTSPVALVVSEAVFYTNDNPV